jgi:polyisoprenoid-binding protein YceI
MSTSTQSPSKSNASSTSKQLNVALLSTQIFASLMMASPVLAANEWSVDPAHSQVNFSVRHMMISNVHGNFAKVEGKAHYDGKDLNEAKVEAKIDVSSIDTHDAQRDGHLKSPDFFDVAKYPDITFVSGKIVPTKDGLDIKGNLTLHGVTKPVTLHAAKLSEPVKDPYGAIRIGTSASTTINRKDFGMTFNKQLDNGGAMVGDEVAMQLDVELTKNKD